MKTLSNIFFAVSFVLAINLCLNCEQQTSLFPAFNLSKPSQQGIDLQPDADNSVDYVSSIPVDPYSLEINCRVKNTGNKTFVSVDSLNKCFVLIKVYNVKTGYLWQYCKDEFFPQPHCIDTNCTGEFVYGTLPPNTWDEYREQIQFDSTEGHYIIYVLYNKSRLYQESEYKNNFAYFGIHWHDMMFEKEYTYLEPKYMNKAR